MAKKIIMPKLGLTMTEGTIVKWNKNIGDSIKAGEILLEIATEKLTNEVQADYDGIVLKLCAEEGDAVQCLEPIAYIGEIGEKFEAEASTAKEKENNKAEVKVAVIGGGPGGYIAAIRAAQLGAKVTLIEKDKLGGTCVNVGCIPTKALIHSADFYREVQNSSHMGIIAEANVDWEKVQANKNKITTGLSKGIASLMMSNKIKVVTGAAEFISPSRLKVIKGDGTEETVEADRIIIASGSVPAIPPIPGIDNKNCIDSTGALNLPEIPKSMVIIGGGVIGIEFASLYNAFGTKVTVIEMLPKLLPMMDGELAAIARNQLVKSGIEIHTEAQVLAIEDCSQGAKVKVSMNGKEEYFDAEKILVAVGRLIVTSSLRLENAGIANERGRIIVDEKQHTNIANIYAIGDCIGKVMLAHTASAQGEVAAENAMGIESVYDESTNPSCVYIHPEFAGVGLTEEKAKDQNINYVVGKFPLIANAKSRIMGCSNGVIKIIADAKYKEILGVHIIGPRATDIIAEGALAIRLEATVEELISTIHAHPTVAEAIREAALNVENRALNI